MQKAFGMNQENKNDEERRLRCSDFMERPGSKAFFIGIVLVALNQFSGITALLSYAAAIFESTGSALDANTSSAVVAAILFIGTVAVSPVIDRAGRKVGI